jgi:hypothetical protein
MLISVRRYFMDQGFSAKMQKAREGSALLEFLLAVRNQRWHNDDGVAFAARHRWPRVSALDSAGEPCQNDLEPLQPNRTATRFSTAKPVAHLRKSPEFASANPS